MFFLILFLAHLQAVIVPIFLGFKSINKFNRFKYKYLIPIGFIYLGLASMCEMIDHMQTNWIYVDHSSLFNCLFYSFLALGLTSLSISVIKDKLNIIVNLLICFFQ